MKRPPYGRVTKKIILAHDLTALKFNGVLIIEFWDSIQWWVYVWQIYNEA